MPQLVHCLRTAVESISLALTHSKIVVCVGVCGCTLDVDVGVCHEWTTANIEAESASLPAFLGCVLLCFVLTRAAI